MKIAVIGAGIFGTEISLKLSREGHDVHLYEKEYEILKGATAGSQNRLHMGLHYPRDLKTAIQSRVGYFKFQDRFREAIREDFPSYYAISSIESKVNTKEFENFAAKAGIQMKRVDKNRINVPVNHQLIDQIYLTREGVIDIDALRKMVIKELEESNVVLRLGEKVTRISKGKNDQFLVDSDNDSEVFQIVIRATYAVDEIEVQSNFRSFEYQQTLVLSIKAELKPVGFTVMDGDFLTLLPHGFTSNFLIYGPSLSTLSKHIGKMPPREWARDGLPESTIALACEQLIERTRLYFPDLGDVETYAELKAIRSIDPTAKATDRRVSRVSETEPGFFEVWSGKIDHCIDVAEEISSLIAARGLIN